MPGEECTKLNARTDAEQVVPSIYNMQQSTVWGTSNNMHHQVVYKQNKAYRTDAEQVPSIYNIQQSTVWWWTRRDVDTNETITNDLGTK